MANIKSVIAAAAFGALWCSAAHAEQGPLAFEAADGDTQFAAQAFARVRWGAESQSDPDRFAYGLAFRASTSCGLALSQDIARSCLAAPRSGVEFRNLFSAERSAWLVGADQQALRLHSGALYANGEEESSGGGSAWPWMIGGAVVLGGGAYMLYKELDDDVEDGIGDMMDDIFS